MSWKEKVDNFYEAMKEKGYRVKLNKLSVDSFDYQKLEHVVTKDDYYHVSLNEHLIVDAPLDYVVSMVEYKFKELESK